MNVKGLQYIVEIGKQGSLSAAAKELGVSQPTLSNYLSSLEKSLGVDLFVREKRRMFPSPAGRIYIDAAEKIITIKDQTYHSIQMLKQAPIDVITIGATPMRGSIMIAQLFSQFNKRFPNIRLEIKESYMSDLKKNVLDQSVNFALGSCYDVESSDFDYATIAREEIVIGVPSFYPLAREASEDPDHLASIPVERLADFPFVLMSPGNTVRSISDSILQKANLRPLVVFETSNTLVLANMLQRGTGVGFLPRSSMFEKKEDIVYFSIDPPYYLTLAVLIRKNHRLTTPERYFIYLVIKHDEKNPLYYPFHNQYSLDILKEFDG
ncbi:MAG: LysR family transcriptional regulator [Clostridiales bacterium]|nr:LysR family transcriptional regulator [Clostridiales bacterium]